MDLLYLKALILGVVEGLTEFLPISSTGHLIVVGDLLNFNDEKGKVFEVVIQLGAILAVWWEFRGRIFETATGMFRDERHKRFVTNLLVAFMPSVIFGLMFHKALKTYLFNPFTVGIALIIGAFIIIWVERRSPKPRINNIDELTWRDALKIGLAQAVSIIPGTSRSGATIIGGMFFGLSRPAATEFSFFLAIPTMIAATTYDVYKSWGLFQVSDLGFFSVGFIAAFISAFITVKILIRYVATHTFIPFAWYRIVFGVILIFYFW